MAWSFYNSSGKLIDGVLDSSITNAKMVDDAIDSDEIVAGSIDNAHMSVNSIDSDQYVDGSIDLAHMSVNSIDSDQYVDASIDSAHIANDQIDSQHYAAGSIDLEHMASQSVDEDNLYISNAGSNGEFLSKQSGNNGGLTWVAAGGGPSQANQAALEAETNEDTYAPPDLIKNSPGVAKAWCRIDTDGTLIAGSYNIASITDDDTGERDINILTDFSDADFTVSGLVSDSVNATQRPSSFLAGSFHLRLHAADGTFTDLRHSIICHGELV